MSAGAGCSNLVKSVLLSRQLNEGGEVNARYREGQVISVTALKTAGFSNQQQISVNRIGILTKTAVNEMSFLLIMMLFALENSLLLQELLQNLPVLSPSALHFSAVKTLTESYKVNIQGSWGSFLQNFTWAFIGSSVLCRDVLAVQDRADFPTGNKESLNSFLFCPW